jgi:GT2 family glycosyltransferase
MNLIASRITDLSYLSEISESRIIYEHEFLDLYGFCSQAQRRRVVPFFDQEFYLERNPDVRGSGLSPLVHFLHFGIFEWRNPHPLIDLAFIEMLQPDIFCGKPQIELLEDCLVNNLADPSPFFSIKTYKAQLAENDKFAPALLHYLSTGAEEGMRPNAYFDPRFYRKSYEDLPNSELDAFLHFVCRGDLEYRTPSAAFDPIAYEEAYEDVRAGTIGPLEHYLRIGRFDGRRLPDRNIAAAGLSHGGGPTTEWHAPVEMSTWRTNSDRLEGKIRERKIDRIRKFREADIRPVRDLDVIAALDAMHFPDNLHPAIDILIPCYNEFEFTVECLYSIFLSETRVAFRIMLLDDASTDNRLRRLMEIPGIHYKRNSENLHFLRSCNGGFENTRSAYVLLLNNDVQLFAGTIDALFQRISVDPDIAAVGPKILYPNGRLQESGCVVRADGTTGMTGVGDDPAAPCFNYARDVTYISGACLLLRRCAVGSRLFDPAFAPAYCEDTDLCLRLGAAGKRIVYAPEAVAIHHLSVSTKKTSITKRLQMVTKNQETLFRKWNEHLASLSKVRILAFYLPQFHPIRQNDHWWGKGFTEWANVSRARPSFTGHYQPHIPADLGYYDLRVVETMAEQQRLALRYGIEGFVVYYYNFGAERVLDTPINNVLANSQINFRFCLCWANENWTKHWDGGEKEILLFQQYDDSTLDSVCADAVRVAKDPRAITVNGRPLFLVYRPLLVPNILAFTNRLREAYRAAGWPDGHLVYVESMETSTKATNPRSLGFDACVEFPPQGIAVPYTNPLQSVKRGWEGHTYDYEATVVEACTHRGVSYARYPTVFPSWDNTARQPLKGTGFINVGPELFQKYVECKVRFLDEFFTGEERLLFVNAWNEWAEGTHLEPDRAYGHAWLEALKNGVDASTFPGLLN